MYEIFLLWHVVLSFGSLFYTNVLFYQLPLGICFTNRMLCLCPVSHIHICFLIRRHIHAIIAQQLFVTSIRTKFPLSVSNFPHFIFFCKVAFFVRCLAVCFANNPHFYGQAVCLLKLIISHLIRSRGWTSLYPYSDV